MLRNKITIINKLGLHARASMKLMNLASRYQSKVNIEYHNQNVDAKDILEIMVLAASQGAEIDIITDGPDETEAMEKIAELINDRFGEDE